MIMKKRTLLLFAAGMAVVAGKLWADNMAPAGTPAAAAPASMAAKPAHADSPTVAAMKAANALEAAGNTADAIAAYEKMGVLKSKKMEAWRLNNEGLAYLAANDVAKATPLFEKATETDDANYVAWNNLGTCYESSGDNDKAKDAYQKSIDAAKAAGASSAKADGNLAALQARMDATSGKKSDSGDDSGAAAAPATAK
jgi:tetratricopeptide (TPR) repeat protein